ncbi:hypothetical protein RHSIM_Rhsim02G0226700 [Rhododendron simsii]|uniref:Uncharacterized protein n=1 Tax=Rhododendron simsii TaxID=118357 RepID=A0A834H8R6_RHOSS|nr:hypothetical protein RHSIM_Rhsim02G0226700 [Rhododendron simsii]
MPIILLQTQIMESDVSYLSSKVERIIKTRNGQSLIACFGIPYRFAAVAFGASSGKLLECVVRGPKLSVQTSYCMEVECCSGMVIRVPFVRWTIHFGLSADDCTALE